MLIKIKYVLGYITVKGGHRIGITGDVVMENGKVKNISYIYSLNFRIAKQIEGAANNILKYILNLQNNSTYNTLIVRNTLQWKNNNIKRLNKTSQQWYRRI